MSSPPPNDPKNNSGKELTNSLFWTVLAVAVAVFWFVYSGKVDAEKKNFYLIAGGIAAVVAAINGYSAWTLYNKSKPPASK